MIMERMVSPSIIYTPFTDQSSSSSFFSPCGRIYQETKKKSFVFFFTWARFFISLQFCFFSECNLRWSFFMFLMASLSFLYPSCRFQFSTFLVIFLSALSIFQHMHLLQEHFTCQKLFLLDITTILQSGMPHFRL